MSSVVSSAPLSLIWQGVWDSDGINSSGYQRYDCVRHTVTSPTTRTDVYFAVTEIPAGGDEPNPTTGQTTWKLLLKGGTFNGSITATDGSIIFHNADGEQQIINAVADTIIQVVNGLPQFVQAPPASTASLFIGYTHPNTPPHGSVPTSCTFFLSGDRVFGLGSVRGEGHVDTESRQAPIFGNTGTIYPSSFSPRDDEAQMEIGKIFHGYRCVFAIGKDDKSKVYLLGLKAGRFGDGEDTAQNPDEFIEDYFQKIEYFDTNGINIEHIINPFISDGNSFIEGGVDNARRNGSAITYFIEEVVNVGGTDTGGRVFASAGPILDAALAHGINADGTVQEITGFSEPIIGGSMYHEAVFFWSKRKVFGLGRVTLGPFQNQLNINQSSAVWDLTNVTSSGVSGGSFSSDIVSFFNTDDISAVLTLADGTAYYYNYKAPRGTRLATLFEQIPAISGKLFVKVVCFANGQTIAALMDDGTVYVEGVVRQGTTNRTITGLQEIPLPHSLVARDIFYDRGEALHIITTDGNVITHKPFTNQSIFGGSSFTRVVNVGGSPFQGMTLYTDPGWAGRANDIIHYNGLDYFMISISTEDGYIYNSNTVGGVATQTGTTGRNHGVNQQFQVLYIHSASTTVLSSSFGEPSGFVGNSATGLASRRQGSYSIQVNGSMVQRPTLRSYQIG